MAFGLSAGAATLIGAVAAPVIGGIMGAGAAEDGYAAQEAGAARSDATQRYMYDTTRADNAPFLRNGTNASNRLSYLMGLGGGRGSGSAPRETADQIRARLLNQYTKTTGEGEWTFNPNGKSGVGHTWENRVNTPLRFEPAGTTVDEVGLNAAIQAALAGQSSEQEYDPNDPAAGSLVRKFSQSDLDSDVVYSSGLQFGLEEGRKGIERQQQASGSLLSGATLKRLSRFGTDYGTTKAEGAYNRYTQDNTNTYNRLAGIAGSGQTASAQVGGAGQNYANNVSQTAQGLGNARAASGIAGSNAIGGGLQGAFNNYQSGRLLQQIQRSPGYGVGGSNIGAEPYDGYNASVGLG